MSEPSLTQLPRYLWIAQILREIDSARENLIPGGAFPGGSRFSAFASSLPASASVVEQAILRGLLLDVSLEWGEVVHRAQHASSREASACRFASRTAGFEVWADRAQKPRVAFEEWAARYAVEFNRIHPRSPAKRLREHIDACFASPLRVGQLAAKWNTSTRLLQREFVALTGMRIQDYITARRVRAACDLLGSSGDKVESVARAVGWSSRKNLNRALAKHVNVLPNQLRAKRRNPVEGLI